MWNKVFLTALMVSAGAHIIVMSVMGIAAYEVPGRSRPYTRIDFLGPILGKTAFDMMLGHSDKIAGPALRRDEALGKMVPKVRSSKKDMDTGGFPDVDVPGRVTGMEGYLAGEKAVPRFLPGGPPAAEKMDDGARKVIYRPDAPVLVKGAYGGRSSFKIKVKVFVNGEGNVLKVEPLTTTGQPQLDMTAVKYAGRWLYEPRGASSAGEWVEEEIVLKAGE